MRTNDPDPRDAAPPTTDHFELRARSVRDGACVLDLAGALDVASAPRLEHAVAEIRARHGCSEIVLDLSALRHLDSSGLAALLGFRRRLKAACRVVLLDPSEPVSLVLERTGLEGTFDTFETVDDALLFLTATQAAGPELTLSPDAARTVDLARSALALRDSHSTEAICWARLLALAGDPSSPGDEQMAPDGAAGAVDDAPTQVVREAEIEHRTERVLVHAARAAYERGSAIVRTGDILRGVIVVYGALFDRALGALQLRAEPAPPPAA